MPELRWTREPPTEAGWYWRRGGMGRADLFFVGRHGDKLACIHAWDYYRERRSLPGTESPSVATFVDDLDVLWAGPIPEPEDTPPA